jgi:membrane fusion protein, multidrug efflux system
MVGMRSRRVILFFVALALAFTSACSKGAEQAAEQAAAPLGHTPPPLVDQNPSNVIASGPIVVEQQVEMESQIEGTVIALHVDLGSSVQKGQLLAQLDDRQISEQRDALAAKTRAIEADLKNWEALAAASDSETARAKEMWTSNLIPQQEFERVQYRSQAAHFEVEREKENLNDHLAQLRALESQVGKTRIVAPFSGVVARRYITVGQKIATNEKLFWVTAIAPMRVRFMMPEKYIGQIKSGTELALSSSISPDAPELQCTARVLRMSPVVDPSSGTVEAIAELIAAPPELRPGMTASLSLKR